MGYKEFQVDLDKLSPRNIYYNVWMTSYIAESITPCIEKDYQCLTDDSNKVKVKWRKCRIKVPNIWLLIGW